MSKTTVLKNIPEVENVDNADHYYSPRQTTTSILGFFADFLKKHWAAIVR